ncbi:MAG: lipid II flippase MurJ [Arenicellales bacterium]
MKAGAVATRTTIGRTTAWLLPLQAILRIGEALFPLFLAAWFGSNRFTDVYVFSYAYFTFCGALVFSAFRDSAVVPLIMEVRRSQPEDLGRFLGSLICYATVLGLAGAALTGSIAAAWFPLRYGGPERDLALAMLPIFCGHLIIVVLEFLLSSVLQAMHRFAAAPLASGLGMLVALLAMGLLRHTLGVQAIAWAHLLGEAVALGILAIWAFGPVGLPVRLTFERLEPLRRFGRLAVSQVGAQAINRVNPLVDQLFAGLVALAGGGTLLKLTSDVALAPVFLLAGTVLPVLLSHLSEDFLDQDRVRLGATVRQTLLSVVLVFGVIAGLMVLAADPLLRLLYLRGEMTVPDIHEMVKIITMLALGLPAYAAALTLTRVHVAVGNTPLLLPIGAASAGFNVVFNLVLYHWLGIPGIALSTSLVSFVVAGLLWYRLSPVLHPGARQSC